ncbi:hypothetical protein ONZ45_g18342 [Pleurotus djamor]|nr:hypothetical protein ONZ45_g18342 [Pleurotus djamor]
MPKNPPIVVSRDMLKRHNKDIPPPFLPPVPLDVIHEIALHLSARDLLSLARVNKRIRTMLCNKQAYWKNARLAFPIPIPEPLIGSEYATISSIFGGGNCSICNKFISTIPYSWSLKLRKCSVRCQSIIDMKRVLTIPGRKKVEHKVWRNKFRPWLHAMEQQPGRVPRASDEALYRRDEMFDADKEYLHAKAVSHRTSPPAGYKGPRRTLRQLEAEYKTRAEKYVVSKQDFQNKRDWAALYSKAFEHMHRVNKSFVEAQLTGEVGERRHAARSRRMKQYALAYSQDLEEFTLEAWEICLADVMKQNEQDRSVKSFYFTKHKILGCAHCPKRYFDSEGLMDHTSTKHPEMKEEMFNLLTKKSLKRCHICGSHRKLFNEQGLRDHMIHKHQDEVENKPPAAPVLV